MKKREASKETFENTSTAHSKTDSRKNGRMGVPGRELLCNTLNKQQMSPKRQRNGREQQRMNEKKVMVQQEKYVEDRSLCYHLQDDPVMKLFQREVLNPDSGLGPLH